MSLQKLHSRPNACYPCASLYRCDRVKMRSHWVMTGRNPRTGVTHTVTDIQMECGHGQRLEGCVCERGRPAMVAPVGAGRGGKDPLPEPSEGAGTLKAGFRPPELGEPRWPCVEFRAWGSSPRQPQEPDPPPSKGKGGCWSPSPTWAVLCVPRILWRTAKPRKRREGHRLGTPASSGGATHTGWGGVRHRTGEAARVPCCSGGG